jgi:hypothetical protein
MNCSPTLTPEEFSDVHNGKCKLCSVIERLSNVVAPAVLAELQAAVDLLNKGLQRAYDLDDAEWERKHSIAKAIGEANGFKSAWSISEVDNFTAVPFPTATQVTYIDHWGPHEVLVKIKLNSTWEDLWRAADTAIALSTDQHHIFIERFKLADDGFTLILSTGS